MQGSFKSVASTYLGSTTFLFLSAYLAEDLEIF